MPSRKGIGNLFRKIRMNVHYNKGLELDFNGNKIAFVEGAASSIRKIAADKLAKHGAIVFVGGRREIVGEEVVNNIYDKGGEAHFIRMDVTDEVNVRQVLRMIADRNGKLDLAVNVTRGPTHMDMVGIDENAIALLTEMNPLNALDLQVK
jgi:NAD(P)-dependent dehydrogenase (short-subunit alcohol dehydrogenase family)